MSQHRISWADVVATALRQLPGRLAIRTIDQREFFKRADFRRICDEIETALTQAGIGPHISEWQATKSIMKSIYKKTQSAHKNGYNFFQYALTPYLDEAGLKELMSSPDIQRGVEVWCSLLGWRRANIVNWTSVEAAIAKVTASRYPYAENEFAVRLEGLGRPSVASGTGWEILRHQSTEIRPSGFGQ